MRCAVIITFTSSRATSGNGSPITLENDARTVSIIVAMCRSMTAATNASLLGKYW